MLRLSGDYKLLGTPTRFGYGLSAACGMWDTYRRRRLPPLDAPLGNMPCITPEGR
jgi:hypothetical protein